MIVDIVLLILVKMHVLLQMFQFPTDIRKLFITFCNVHNFCIEPYIPRESRRGPSNRMLYLQNSDCQKIPSGRPVIANKAEQTTKNKNKQQKSKSLEIVNVNLGTKILSIHAL